MFLSFSSSLLFFLICLGWGLVCLRVDAGNGFEVHSIASKKKGGGGGNEKRPAACCCDYASAFQGGQRMAVKELSLLPVGIDD